MVSAMALAKALVLALDEVRVLGAVLVLEMDWVLE